MEVNRNNFLYTLSKIRQKLFAYLETELAKNGIRDISPSYGDVLFALDLKGPLPLREIARYANKDKSTVSSVVKRLEEAGYVVKERGEDDGRFVRITLTARAKKIRPLAWKISREMNDRLFAGLSEREQALLFKLVGRVHDNV